MSKLIEFLRKAAPILSLNAIEIEAGIPQATLHKAMSGERKLPNQHVFGLMKVLIKHLGEITIDGWRYHAEEWEPIIFATKDVDAPTSEEVGGGFQYHQKQYKEFCDFIEIAERVNEAGSAEEFMKNWKKKRDDSNS